VIRVVKTDGILPAGPRELAHFDGLEVDFVDRPCLTEDALIAECSDAAALLVIREPITSRVISALKSCRVISRFGVGLDNIDIAAATAAGIKVTNVPDANTDEVSTHTLAMMLSLIRRLPRYDSAVRAGRWFAMSDGAGMMRTENMTLGLIGCGRIGRDVLRKAAVFGFKTLVHDPGLDAGTIARLGATGATLEEVLRQSDIVSLHIPLTPHTTRLLDGRAIALMKPNAIIINTSRGALLDEAAVGAALMDGRLGGAGLDAFVQEPIERNSRLLEAPNTIFSPHAAHYSEQSVAETCRKAFANVAAVLRGQPALHPVN
jgi:D-3-phosphoglycerate dehydrogenase / 2-oxoglutarate reductase